MQNESNVRSKSNFHKWIYLTKQEPRDYKSIAGSHLRCKTSNKRLQVRERVEMLERNKYDRLGSLAFLSSVIICERNPDLKKNEII